MNRSSRDLEGNVLVVTGGSRGIGRQIVLQAIARGARVVFCARTISPAVRLVMAEAAQVAGPDRVIGIAADVSRADDVEALFYAAIQEFGRVDIVINNAGVSYNYLLVSMPTAVLDEMIATNLTGSFLVARQAVHEFMRQQSGGKIITLGSIMQNGASSNTGYATSKGGLIGLTRSIAWTYGARGIMTYLVAAGYVETDMTRDLPSDFLKFITDACPQKRRGVAAEVAAAALFLASPRSAAVMNGDTLYVSGGLVDIPAAL